MNESINKIIDISGPVMILSLFAMTAYLFRKKVYTALELRKKIIWPSIVFEYRDHTKKYNGKVGIYYYIFCPSALITTVLIIFQAATIAHEASTPIFITAMITAATIIPIICYWIYSLWKGKYF